MAKSTFVETEITFKVAVITSLVATITFVVTFEITLKVAVITFSVDTITFVVAKIQLYSCCDHIFSGQNQFCSD